MNLDSLLGNVYNIKKRILSNRAKEVCHEVPQIFPNLSFL